MTGNAEVVRIKEGPVRHAAAAKSATVISRPKPGTAPPSMQAKPARISSFNYLENSFEDGDKVYRVKDLIKAAEGLEQFDMPLAGIATHGWPWAGANIKSFIYHMKRVQEADMGYPIILATDGYICDGWHRVCKAILEGRSYIRAVRLEVMPEPDRKTD